MADKQLTIKRILIFLFFAFVPPWIFQFVYAAIFGWTIDTKYYTLLGCVSMLFPAIGNFLTRIITKEGFKDSCLKFNLKGNIKYYLIAVLLPVVYYFITTFVIIIGYMPSGTMGEIMHNANLFHVLSASIYIITLSVLDNVITFGEEFGWRGYLTPKLEELAGTRAAYIISGIIWGLWHAPIIVMGHNFGKEYKYYPYAGIIAMCVSCIFIGAFYSVLTKKTKSVFPAAISHAMNNDFVNIIFVILMASSSEEKTIPVETIFTIICISVSIAAVIINKSTKFSSKQFG